MFAAILVLLSLLPACHAAAGHMTMWTDQPTTVQGAYCEYASSTATQRGKSWWKPYINSGMYCAVNEALKDSGMGCGRCYKISYDGSPATDPGRAGSAKIQVVDSGSAHEFDCYVNAFKKITGARTGVFPITYKEIPCKSNTPKAVVLDGNNAWYTKVLLAGGPTSVKSAAMKVGSNSYKMFRVSGATFAANLQGVTNKTTMFIIKWTDGTKSVIKGCFGNKWPVSTGEQCA